MKRFPRYLFTYLLLSGLIAHLVVGAVYVHYLSTGLTAYTYVSKVVKYLNRDSSPTRHVAHFTKRVVLDSGLLGNSPHQIKLPPFPGPEAWPAQGTIADGFQYPTYDARGVPQQAAIGPFYPGPHGRVRRVADEKALVKALRNARAGDVLVLEPGIYRFSQHNIKLGGEGRAGAPIIVRAERFGEVQLELDTLEGFLVGQPYWLFENLKIRGTCKDDSRCEHAFHVVGSAVGTILRNNELIDFNAPLKVNGAFGKGGDTFPDHGLFHNNIVYNSGPRRTGNPVTLLNINAGSGWVVSANFIADFSKAGSDLISYAAFMKSNSSNGIFERNLVVCHWRLPIDQGVRVGLSFGGGGSAASTSRNRSNKIEHTAGIMRNNIVARCPLDVGIYLNKSAHTLIQNNLLLDTRGIDVRFKTSSATISDNVIDGRIHARDGGVFTEAHNLTEAECSWIESLRNDCGTASWYAAPLAGDLRITDAKKIIGAGSIGAKGSIDFCGNTRTAGGDIGPIEYGALRSCLPGS